MKRLLGLTVLALGVLAGSVQADGCCGPGFFSIGARLNGAWGPGKPGCAPGPTAKPGIYGPWYNYWPLEAHFQTPAHPQYPFWPSPQTLPNGAPLAAPATINYPPVPAAGPPPAAYGAPAPGYAPQPTAYAPPGGGYYPPANGYAPAGYYPGAAGYAPAPGPGH